MISTSDKNDIALEMIGKPEFWCRAKLFRSLRAAQKAGVLDIVLNEFDEFDDDDRDKIIEIINEHLRIYWHDA